ncbi:MAG TPA: hypothetical protein PKI03_05785 [Pseudomonadota bacterium]|nr:hypothetical protein [Pseudomonadota bacterium]
MSLACALWAVPQGQGPLPLGPSVSWAAKKGAKPKKDKAGKVGKPGKPGKGVKAGKGEPKTPPPPDTPPQPIVAPPPPTILPSAALRLECESEGGQSRLCEVVREAALQVATHRYQVLDKARVEELFAKEPSLRGCRRDDCRTAIAESLGVSRLIDIIVQSPKPRDLSASVSVFDLAAKGLSQDTVVQLTRDERALRRTIEQAVDQVITTQRLTAPLRLEVKPVGAKVRLVDSRGNTRDLTDAERDGSRELRVFLGTCSVHVEKPGYLAQDTSVIVTQAGAQLSVELKNQPVAVKFEWTPEGTRVKVDGEEVDSRDRVIELSEGPHRVEAFARTASYESTVFPIEVRVGMEPVRIALQRLTEIRLQAPRGYTISVDGQLLSADRLHPRGLFVEAVLPTTPGGHTVTAQSWRGLQLSQRVMAVPRTATDLSLRPPSLVPGAVIGTLGLVSALAGGALFIVGYTQPICTRQPDCEALFKPDIPGGILLGIGGAALIVGAGWFGWAASHHPRFHSDKPATRDREARLLGSSPTNLWSVRPVVGPTFAGVQSELRF